MCLITAVIHYLPLHFALSQAETEDQKPKLTLDFVVCHYPSLHLPLNSLKKATKCCIRFLSYMIHHFIVHTLKIINQKFSQTYAIHYPPLSSTHSSSLKITNSFPSYVAVKSIIINTLLCGNEYTKYIQPKDQTREL